MASYYNTGSVGVTNGSVAVTGAGTAWAQIVRAGDQLIAPDGRSYVIAGVSSDSAMTLSRAYLGATASGQAYDVVFSAGRDADVAAALGQLIGAYQAVHDGPGQGRFADGTLAAPGVAFAADLDTGLRRAGSNALAVVAGGVDRLTVNAAGAALTGLLSGTAVQQGATDTTAGRLMRADYGFSRGNLLGTVGQSAGVPTGAVIERGSNANGDYVRFADGTQICAVDGVTFTYSSADHLSFTWAFPAAFAAGTSPIRNIAYSNGDADLTGITMQSLGKLRLGSGVVSAANRISRAQGAESFVSGNQVANCKLTAIGRWF